MQVLTDLKSKKVVSPNPFRDQAIPNYSCALLGEGRVPSGSRSFRTYMSIEERVGFVFKVR